jgi:hypothetical protein
MEAMMRRSGVVFLLAATILMSAGACANEVGVAPPPAWTSCPVQPAERTGTGGLPHLSDSFHPVAAVVCSTAARRRIGGGEEQVATEGRAQDVTALVAALRLPDEPLSGEACTTELWLPPYFVLLDEQDRWVRPGLPHDGCGKVRVEVRNALQALRLTPVPTRPVQEIESSEAAAAGCSQRWADMVWATGQMGSATPEEPAVVPPGFDGPVQVRLCVYRVPADQRGTGKPAGNFVSGRYLDEQQWAAARREIEAAATAPPCTTPASRFAVLHYGAGQLHVELDGCRRLLAPTAAGGETLRQASPGLVALG